MIGLAVLLIITLPLVYSAIVVPLAADQQALVGDSHDRVGDPCQQEPAVAPGNHFFELLRLEAVFLLANPLHCQPGFNG
jgi:hypothetical protein